MYRLLSVVCALSVCALTSTAVPAQTVRVYESGAIPNPYVVARILDPTLDAATPARARGLHSSMGVANAHTPRAIPAATAGDAGRDMRERRINMAAASAVAAWHTQIGREPQGRATHDGALARTSMVSSAAQARPTALALMVKFPSNSARLSRESFAALDAVAAGIKLMGHGRKIVIEGHTDASGNAAHNVKLSRQRAASVRQYLVRKHAIPAQRLMAVGFGAKLPLDSRNRLAPENRRVQFRTLEAVV